MRPAGTPNVGPSAINTMEMSIAKQKAAQDKKGLAAAKKAVLKQKCMEAQLALVRLLVPSTTHPDSVRVMSEQELLALTYPQLAAHAALLMTSEDPQGMVACGGIAIDQVIIALGAVAPKEQGKQIAVILNNKHDELTAIDAVNAYMGRPEPHMDFGDDGGDDGTDGGGAGNADDYGSLPGGYDDDEDSSEDESEEEDDVTFIDTSSSSRLPAALATVGLESAVGTEVVRDVHKRKSVRPLMFGEFEGQVSQPVLGNIANPVFKQSKSKKQRQSATEAQHTVPMTSVPSTDHGVNTGALQVDESPSSDADGVSSTNSSDADDNDCTRLFFEDNGLDDMHDADAPDTATLPGQVDGSTVIDVGSAGAVIEHERTLKDKLQQQPELGPVGGQNNDLVLQCFTAAPEFQLHRYREPGTVLATGAGPLPLQQVISPTAAAPLAPQVHDNKVLSERYRNSSFGQQVTMLHKTWNALHNCTSWEAMRGWLEGMQPSSHIILVWSRAAYLNCLPDYLSTFGEAKSAFWDMAQAFGDFSSGKFVVDCNVSLAAVTVPYFLVRSLNDWLRFCNSHFIDITDIWQIEDVQEFAALDDRVYPSLHLCMAMLIALVNFCSMAYRNAFTIEIMLQRQVYPCRDQQRSGLTLTNVDANLAVQSYFPDEPRAAVIGDTTGIDLLNSAVTWVKTSLSVAAIRADINNKWLQLLSTVFRPLIPMEILNTTQQEAVLLAINPLRFSNSELREIYPMLLKGPTERLLEYLNNNPMAALLYGSSVTTETYGGLCLKLLGCLVATLQELYDAINVDAWLSVSDIAFLMNKGGVLASADGRHVFESSVFYVFTTATMPSKLRELLESGMPMPLVSVPRDFTMLTSKKSWVAYYNRQFLNQTKATAAQRTLQKTLALVTVPPSFARQVACFEISKQSKAIVQAAAPKDCVRVLASNVRKWLSQNDSPPAAPTQVIPVNNVAAANVLAANVSSAAAAIGSQGSALVNLVPPVPRLTAIYGNISAQRRDRYASYVTPDSLAIAAQQRIVGWDAIVDFVFDAAGEAYMRSLTLCTTQQRPPIITDNFVFLYDPANQFTPDNPFPSICAITHLWYRLTAIENGWHYFDFENLLCKLVSTAVIPLQIKIQYRGTYLLYSPPTPGSIVPPSNQQPTIGSNGTTSRPPPVSAAQQSQQGSHPTASRGSTMQSAGASPASGYAFGVTSAYPLSPLSPTAIQVPAQQTRVAALPTPVAAVLPTVTTDYDSDDSEQRKMVKVATLQYEGEEFRVLGKESVIKILRETQSVRTLMEHGQLELLVRHEGNFANHYTKEVFRAGILRQHSLATIHVGMTLLVNDNHDLLRFKALVCFDVPELQHSLYTLKHEFPYLQTSNSLHPVHYLTKADASACSYDIRTYDMWVKTWDGIKLAFKLILGPTYGVALASIITDLQQHSVGQLFDVDYLLALQSTLLALIFNYSSTSDEFVIGAGTQRFQPQTMTSDDWQTVIGLLWSALKSQLTYGLQQEVSMTRARYNQVKCKPIQFRTVKPAGVIDVQPKVKVPAAAGQPKKKKSPPAKAEVKKVEFAAADINICISDIARHYRVITDLEKCTADCKYVHYNQLPSTMTKAILTAKVQKLAEKCNLTEGQVKFFLARVAADKKFK